MNEIAIESLLVRLGFDPSRNRRRHNVCPACGAGGADSIRLEWRPDRGTHGTIKCWACGMTWNPAEMLAYLETGGQDAADIVQARRSLGMPVRDSRGRRGRAAFSSSAARSPEPAPSVCVPPPETMPSPEWQEAADAFTTWAAGNLENSAEALTVLAAHGLDLDAAFALGYGWCPRDIVDSSARWGMDFAAGDAMRIPAGLVLPVRRAEGIFRVRIRCRDHRPGRKYPPKYMELRGGGRGPAMWGEPGARAVVVVEAEMDGGLLALEAPDDVAVIALGGVDGGVSAPAWEMIRRASGVLVAFDNDIAGADMGAAWCSALPSAILHPPVDVSGAGREGMGPGDMPADVRAAWLEAGLRRLGLAAYNVGPELAAPLAFEGPGASGSENPGDLLSRRAEEEADAMDLEADGADVIVLIRLADGWMPARACCGRQAAAVLLTRPLRPRSEAEAFRLAWTCAALWTGWGAAPAPDENGAVKLVPAGHVALPGNLAVFLPPPPTPDLEGAGEAIRAAGMDDVFGLAEDMPEIRHEDRSCRVIQSLDGTECAAQASCPSRRLPCPAGRGDAGRSILGPRRGLRPVAPGEVRRDATATAARLTWTSP